MTCPRCGSQLREGAQYCQRCGLRAGEPSPVPVPSLRPAMPLFGLPPVPLPRPRGMSVAALVLGILSMSCIGFATGPIAIGLGSRAIGLCNRGRYGGRGMAIAGMVLGIVGTVVGGVMFLGMLLSWGIMAPFRHAWH